MVLGWLLVILLFGVVVFLLAEVFDKPGNTSGQDPEDTTRELETHPSVLRDPLAEEPTVEPPHKPSAETLNKVLEIALIKDELPFHLAAQTSALGLYVRSSSAPKDTLRILAGAKTKPYLDVFARLDGTFDVKRYRPGEWEALVNPTLELARQLSGSDRLGLD